MDVKPTKDFLREDFARMHKELTNDDDIAEARRRTDRAARIAEKISDTGL